MKWTIIVICSLAAGIPPAPILNNLEPNLISRFTSLFSSSKTVTSMSPAELQIIQNENKWLSLSNSKKSLSISKLEWSQMTESQKFWSMKDYMKIDPLWSEEWLQLEITHFLPNIRKTLRSTQSTWEFKGSLILHPDQVPARLHWIRQLPAKKRTQTEAQLLSFFPTSEAESGTFQTFSQFNEAAKSDILKAALVPIKGAKLKKDLIYSKKPWRDIPDDMRFRSFKEVFQISDRPLTLELFREMVARDVASIRAILKHRLDELDMQEAIYPEQLFWIESIPIAQRTTAEQQFFEKYGHGFFDKYKSVDRRIFAHLSEQDKITRLRTFERVPFTETEIQWLQAHPFEALSPDIKNRMLNYMPWSKLPEQLQYVTFTQAFHLETIPPSLNDFNKMMETSLPALRRLMQPQIDSRLSMFGVSRQQLFWIQHIPALNRNDYENEFISAYGHGHFDGHTSELVWDKFLRWEARETIDQEFQLKYMGINPVIRQ